VNWWQNGHDIQRFGTTAMTEACVSRYAQTIAMCPGAHWRTKPDGGRERITNSALSRVLRKPNGYQSISDFLLNATRSLYLQGNAYALAVRNDRFEIAELHLMSPRDSGPMVAGNGEVFYRLTGNELIERRLGRLDAVPGRDVLHIRLHTPWHPLRGETPLAAAALQMAAGNSALQQQVSFFLNQARPSYVLSTDQVLTKDQIDQLRTKWNEQSQGLNAGGTPILSAGLKPLPLTSNARDAQLAEMMKLNDQAIANVFGIPLQLFGVGGGTPQGSTQALMRDWLAGALGFAINHIEVALDALFGLRGQPEEYTEFDTNVLLRSSKKERVEAATLAIRGGLSTINEERLDEDKPKIAGGDDIRIQQQDVPLDWHEQQLPKNVAPPSPAAPVPDPQPTKDISDAGRNGDWTKRLLQAADEYERRAA
jgi:HK97 family phage portal protein